jgi:hypothetical protein
VAAHLAAIVPAQPASVLSTDASNDLAGLSRLVERQGVHFTIEGTLRVWNVPSYRINGRLIEGWTMIRVEAAAVIGSQPR